LTEGLSEEPQIANFDPVNYVSLLPKAKNFSPAYNSSPPAAPELIKAGLPLGTKTALFHLTIIKRMLDDGLPDRIQQRAKSLHTLTALLQHYPRFGDFRSAQYSLDLNYGPFLNLPVDDFVVSGPGCQNGIAGSKTAPGVVFFNGKRGNFNDVVMAIHRHQDALSELITGRPVPTLKGRKPSPMSVQNWLCEISKYLRGGSKNTYCVPPNTHKPLPAPLLPAWWS
jgi:hypothetical protein